MSDIRWEGEICFIDSLAWATELVEIAASQDDRQQWDAKPLCLGQESQILPILKGQAPIPADMNHRRRAVLEGILERSADERKGTVKPNSSRQLRAIKAGYLRVRPAKGVKHRAKGIKRS